MTDDLTSTYERGYQHALDKLKELEHDDLAELAADAVARMGLIVGALPGELLTEAASAYQEVMEEEDANAPAPTNSE